MHAGCIIQWLQKFSKKTWLCSGEIYKREMLNEINAINFWFLEIIWMFRILFQSLCKSDCNGICAFFKSTFKKMKSVASVWFVNMNVEYVQSQQSAEKLTIYGKTRKRQINMCTLKKKIRRYRNNCGSLTYITLEIYRKPRFACISSACMCIPTIWIIIAAIFLVNCEIYFLELLKNIQLYSNGW